MADRLAHAAHLAVAALVQHELELPGAEPAYTRRRSDAVLELDSLGEPAQRLVVRLLPRLDLVDLLDAVARVRKPVRERAVVREQEHAGRVDVEPPDRDDPRLVLDERDDGRPALRVAGRRDDARGLVQEHVGEPLLRDRPAVHLDDVPRLDERVQLARLAVHAHAAGLDQLVRLAAGGDTRPRAGTRSDPHRRSVVCRPVRDRSGDLERLAELLVGFGANLQPGQILGVTAYLGMEDAARAVARAGYRHGAKYVDVFWWDHLVKRARLELAGRRHARLRAALDRAAAGVALQRARRARHADRHERGGLRRDRPGPDRTRPAAVRLRGAADRQRPHDELVGRPVPQPRLGGARSSRPGACRGARQALGRDRPRLPARRRRSGGGLARADAGDRRERRPAHRAPLRLAAPARPRHRPDGRPDAELEVARRRLHHEGRAHALPEPPHRGGVHDPRSGARRRPRLGDDAARAVRLVHERDPDRVRGEDARSRSTRTRAQTPCAPRARRTTAPHASARSRSSTRRAGSARSARSSTRRCSTRTRPATSRSGMPTPSRSRTRPTGPAPTRAASTSTS